MNYIFYALIVLSIVIGAINGKLPDVVNSILTGADKAVTISFSLVGVMAFWLGIMKIELFCSKNPRILRILSRSGKISKT